MAGEQAQNQGNAGAAGGNAGAAGGNAGAAGGNAGAAGGNAGGSGANAGGTNQNGSGAGASQGTQQQQGAAGASGAGDNAPFLGGEDQEQGAQGQGEQNKGEGEKAKDGQASALSLKLPEGFDPKSPQLTEFTKLATEAKVSPEVAQKFFDLHAAAIKQAGAPLQQAQAETDAERAKWRSEIQGDPNIGGPKLKESLAVANRAIAKFGGNDFVKFLRAEGLTDAPALVRFAHAVGKAMGEDTSRGSQNGVTQRATRNPDEPPPGFYPSMEQ